MSRSHFNWPPGFERRSRLSEIDVGVFGILSLLLDLLPLPVIYFRSEMCVLWTGAELFGTFLTQGDLPLREV